MPRNRSRRMARSENHDHITADSLSSWPFYFLASPFKQQTVQPYQPTQVRQFCSPAKTKTPGSLGISYFPETACLNAIFSARALDVNQPVRKANLALGKEAWLLFEDTPFWSCTGKPLSDLHLCWVWFLFEDEWYRETPCHCLGFSGFTASKPSFYFWMDEIR